LLGALVFLRSVLVFTVGCGPTQQGLPGYNLQEILLVPVTGGPVGSQTTLLQRTHYKLRSVCFPDNYEALGQVVDVIQSSVGAFFGLLILLVVSTSKRR
jgi:hypothetical protein